MWLLRKHFCSMAVDLSWSFGFAVLQREHSFTLSPSKVLKIFWCELLASRGVVDTVSTDVRPWHSRCGCFSNLALLPRNCCFSKLALLPRNSIGIKCGYLYIKMCTYFFTSMRYNVLLHKITRIHWHKLTHVHMIFIYMTVATYTAKHCFPTGWW